MKNKKGSLRKLTPMPAAAAVLAMAASGAHAQTPVFDYTFPASWNGTGTTVVDQSSAGNNGIVYNYSSTAGLATSANVPPGAAGGTESINGSYGGIVTGANGSLDNSIVAADGGFTYNVEFYWPGTAYTGFGVQKIIDYAGTESLQLANYTQNTVDPSATLEMVFGGNGAGAAETTAVSTTVLANTWYNVTLTFNTEGNSLIDGDISGIADLYVNGVLVSSGAATKGTYGDSLDRPIGVANLGANFGSLVGFSGDIYSASVDLGGFAPVPEPSTIAFAGLGGLSFILMRRKKS